MPYVTNQGVRIHYQVEGSGTPMVLCHGATSSGEDWRDAGYVDALKGDYLLVLVDGRGHGDSDKPHEPAAYDVKLRVADVVAVLEEVGVSKAHFFGFSLGAALAFGMARYAEDRVLSLVILGAQPYGQSAEGMRQGLRMGMEAFISSMESRGLPSSPEQRARRLRNDTEALLASAEDLPDVSDVLPSMTMPCLVCAGEKDEAVFEKARESVKHMPSATFVALPGLNHIESFFKSELVIPHVAAFLKEIRHTPM